MYCDVIKLVYPHIKAILDEICEEEKKWMQELPQEELDSWGRSHFTWSVVQSRTF